MNKALPLLTLTLCAQLPTAQALDTGDLILRAGVATVMPAGESGNTVPAGANAKIEAENNTQLGLTASYMLSSNVAIGVLASSPFKHDISSAGKKIGETKHLPPTITAQYHFPDLGNIKSYLGAGINYTAFFDEKLNNGTSIELKDSLGLALEAGFDVDLGNNFYANAALWYVDIATEVKLGSTTIINKVDLDPFAAMLGIGKKF